VQMHFLVNTILASNLAEGSLSALNYAWLIMLLPQGIFAQAVATAAFPTFSAQIAAGRQHELRTSFSTILRTVLFLTLPAAVGLLVMGVPIIAVLLQRGEFTAESTQMVNYALQFYALGLLAHGVVEITVRAFYALHDTMTPVVIGIGAMIGNILLSIWLVRPLSFGGLALANSTATTLEMIALLWLLGRRLHGIDGPALGGAILRNGGAAACMGLALWLWTGWSGSAWLTVLGGGIIAVITYTAAAYALRSRELTPVAKLVTGKMRR
jgi:putative peptidoglycan lipid II flippase